MLARSVAAAIGTVNPQAEMTFRPLADQIDASLVQERAIAMLSGFFGGLAVLLAGLGLFGVTTYWVSRRRREIGIRMALGAAPNAVVRLVLARVFLSVGIGVVIGAGVIGNKVKHQLQATFPQAEAKACQSRIPAQGLMCGVAGDREPGSCDVLFPQVRQSILELPAPLGITA